MTINRKNQNELIVGYDALLESMDKCKSGVIWKDSVSHFVLNSNIQLMNLDDSVKNNTYKQRPMQYFQIKEPKERRIASIAFRDRVFQRALNDNFVYPEMSKKFVYDNCACQKRKGTDFARKRLKCHMQRYFRKHGLNGYILQIDIKKYYDNIPHENAEELFYEALRDERVIDCLKAYGGDIGYNPGSQMIQILGLAYLDSIDHYIKETLHAKYYVRYMDDLIIISDDENFLHYCKTEIGVKSLVKGLELHQDKTKIYPLSKGIHFLGFTFTLTNTGKVLMIVDSEKVKRERKKLRRLVRKCYDGELTKDKVDKCYKSWKAHAAKGSSKRLLLNMDRYYARLWKECL